MPLPIIHVDFGNADKFGRPRLSTVGAQEDLARQGITLTEGMRIVGSDHEDFQAVGTVTYNLSEQRWVLLIDQEGLKPITSA